MTPTFLSVGECMVEMAPFDNDLFKMNFAGDTLNTAWYARQLLPVDWRVSYCTCIGEDQLSAQMHAFMEASSIDTSHISTVPNRTVGLYVTQLDGGERSFTYWRENSAARRLAARSDHIEAAFVAAGIIFFSGITLAILPEADRAVFLDQLEKARRNGVQVAFDPNLRPQLWENEDVMCRQIMAAARICDIVMPSFEDEARYFSDENPQKTVNRYKKAGANLLVVKNGPNDILLSTFEGQTTVQAQRAAKVVDTTAAGDSFNAGFLAKLLADETPVDAVQYGSKIAAQVIGQRGALVDLDPDLLK